MKSVHNLATLKQWSCKEGNKAIPAIGAVKLIHVYDFDNTLFSSPMPSPQLWHPGTIGLLQTYEVFAHGGWWHDPNILGATGEGIEVEEPRAWEGWWNETVVQLVEASMQQKDVLTILLTGRGQDNFADLINKMCSSKKLVFDMIVLKPKRSPTGQQFSSTLDFKSEFFRELVFTYKNAEEIRVYEDRVKHVKSFRDHFERLNKSLLSHPAGQPPPERKPITAEVIHVCELKGALNPDTEVATIQAAINRHNQTIREGGPNPCKAPERRLHIKDNFIYFGYLINQHDSARLITLCNTPAHLLDSGEVKLMASNILIAPFYPRKDILDKVGGRGKKVTWQVTGIAKLEDRIWAARVAPVGETQIYTQDPTPLVVLAVRKGARPIDAARIQNWQPVAPEKQFIFETVVGDRMMLKIEQVDSNTGRGHQHGGQTYNNTTKRKFGHEDEPSKGPADNKENTNFQNNHRPGRNFSGKRDQFNNRRNNNNNNSNNPQRKNNSDNQSGYESGANRGANRRQGGPNQGGAGRPRPGKAPPGYKSLDDYGPGNFDGSGDQNSGGGGGMVMNY